MHRWIRICVGVAAGFAAGCTPAVPPPPSLSQHWMIGIEHVQGDPLMLQPLTNRLLADLAAMVNTQVVYVGVPLNGFDFNAYTANKLRLYSSLHAQGNCMEFTYVVYAAGEEAHSFGLVVPALAAGPEPDTACVDRAATGLYQALAGQGM